MVRIIGYKERQSEDRRTFFTLELQAGIEMIRSKSTGSFYATARKASIPSTFDELTCQALIGTEMSGTIIRESCDIYEYTIKETEEVIELAHRYVYFPDDEESTVPGEMEITVNVDTFSTNGVAKELSI